MIYDKVNRLNEAVAKLKGDMIISTQKDISIKMDMNVNTISQALKGNEKYLTDSFLKKFCLSFKTINEDWLLKGIDNNIESREPELSYEKENPKENLQEKYNALMSKYVEVLEENRFVKNDLISQLKKTNA